MISFIHCGSEKRVYMFPRGNKLADTRKEMTRNNIMKQHI